MLITIGAERVKGLLCQTLDMKISVLNLVLAVV